MQYFCLELVIKADTERFACCAMAASLSTDVVLPASSAPSELEIRVALLADPNIGTSPLFNISMACEVYFIDLRQKNDCACEIRDLLDTVRDSESTRALPYLVQAILDLLRSGEPSFQKDSPEYQFRRVLFETLNRLPLNDTVRNKAASIWVCMLYILRHDNEENGCTASKILTDLVRGKSPTERDVTDFVGIFKEAFANMKGLVDQYLAEDSLPLDSNLSLSALRSFKVLAEMAMVMVVMSQFYKAQITEVIKETISLAFNVLDLECPAQYKARTDYEAMGSVWVGMSPTIRNAVVYTDFIYAQVKASVQVALSFGISLSLFPSRCCHTSSM